LEVGRKFQKQLHQVFEGVHNGGNTEQLEERMTKAVQYFSDTLATELLEPVQLHLKQLQYATRVKKYLEEVTQLESLLWQFLQRLQNAKYGKIQFSKNVNQFEKYSPGIQEKKIVKTTKAVKGDSLKETLVLFKQGNDIERITALRNLAPSTVIGHLAFYVSKGEIAVTDIISQTVVENILKVIDEVGKESIGLIKSKLGDEYSYGDIRLVLSHLIFEVEAAKQKQHS
jgi:uncharacterized protein YpbB